MTSEVQDRAGYVETRPEWPLRTVLLAALGLVTGLVTHFLLGDRAFYDFQPSALLLAEMAVVTITAGLIGFTIERRYWWASIAFSVAMGVVAGAVVWWNGNPEGWSASEGWRTVALFLAIAVAAPLFQAARDSWVPGGKAPFPYASVHDHAWTNVVLWAACWVFVGIVVALAFLLAQLFHLIKIDFLKDLLDKNWFWRALIGLAFGGALGILREQGRVVWLLQRVVATVLAVLAPVLAAGLVIFLLALPFTGLAPLWDAGSATGILLACVVGALMLSNAVIGNAPEQERRFPLLRYGAMALAAVMLPLAIIAAVAIGLRIGQYGFTPERLWALTFVILACAWGTAYLVSLVRGRLLWAAHVRPANLVLAFVVCGVAFVLATPLISFNAISVRDQVGRLESGKLAPDKFDWRALAFDFGEPGRAALKRLQASANLAIRERAQRAGKAENRWSLPNNVPTRADVAKQVRVLPAESPPPSEALLDYLARERCGAAGQGGCTVVAVDAVTATLLRDSCFAKDRDQECASSTTVRLVDGKWSDNIFELAAVKPADTKAAAKAQHQAYGAGQIEVRTVERKQVFVGSKPVGDPFE